MGESLASSSTTDGKKVLCPPERRPQVAVLKRIFELWVLDRKFHDAYLADPEAALASTGLEADPRAVSFMLKGVPEGTDMDTLPESLVWYHDLFNGRLQRNMHERANVLPDDPRFRDWTLRQHRRGNRELGFKGRLMLHFPAAFELASGCSVGCPFCALAAGKLKGIFRYTDENAALWRDVLSRLHKIVGDAAARAMLYYATEPLDNPDYERFLEDFYNEFARIPQTTTAAFLRNVERTRELLRWGQGLYEHFDRFSVLSAEMLDKVIETFSPEELIYTDLLPQFAEAPGANFAKAGRNSAEGEEPEGTIACLSGFVINMYDRSVRLVTPVSADREHPTGELILETATFTDADSFEELVLGMIDRHMHETLSIADFFAMGQ